MIQKYPTGMINNQYSVRLTPENRQNGNTHIYIYIYITRILAIL